MFLSVRREGNVGRREANYLLAVGLACVAVVCSVAPSTARASAEFGPDRIVVHGEGASAVIERAPFRLSIQDAAGRTVLGEVPNDRPAPQVEPPTVDPEPNGQDTLPKNTLYSPLTFTVGTEHIEQFPAGTWVADLETAVRSGIQYSARDVIEATPDGDGVRLVLSTSDPTRRLVVSVAPFRPGALRVSARPTPDDGVAIMGDSFATAPDEAFHGFGGRHNALDQRGSNLESFLNQSNVSPGGLTPVAGAPPGAGGDRYMFPNGPEGAYFVQSSFVSSRPYGFLSLRDELTRWRMASDRPDAWQVAASAPALDYVVAPGSAPQAIRTLTSVTGRERVPPRWALEPQMDRLVRFPPQSRDDYRAEVERDLADIERFDIPVKAYRIEAWEFLPRPVLRDLIARFHRRGIRVLLYFRAFVGRDDIGTDRPELFDEAVAKGYVATHADGSPYVFTSNFFAPAAQIDFTNPAARAWWESRIDEALDLGADGFMQDFGEQTFEDMHFHDGSTGATMHNRLPVLFHKATRDAIDSYRRAHPKHGDVFFYTRSGYSGTPGSVAYESATWPGDETTDFSRSSGLAAQAPDMLNRGIAGAYGFGSDIGGYFDAARDPTTKELFLRWAAWSALTPIFRLHGSVTAGTHTPQSYGKETLDRYRSLAELHTTAAPLIAKLWAEAAKTGMPIARPLWLAVPGDPQAARQDQEWMLGPDVLVAPVVEQGAEGRDVYLPAGCWSRPTTRQQFRADHGRSIHAEAPLGTLPYFFRCGTDPFAAAAGKGRCLARHSPIGPDHIGRIALARRRTTLRRRIAATHSTRHTDRWCVKSSHGRAVAVYGRRGRSVLVTATAGRYRLRGVGPGSSGRALRRAFPRRRTVVRGIVRAGARSRRIFGIRHGRVRWVAVADRSLLRSRRSLRQELRRAGLG